MLLVRVVIAPFCRLNSWQALCMALLNKLLDHKDSWPFEDAVDPQAWDVPVRVVVHARTHSVCLRMRTEYVK